MKSLTEKIAVITGSSSGIGRAIAEQLAQDGATVVINYAHSTDKAKAVVSAIESKGGKAISVQADISQVDDIKRLFQKTIEQFGGIDILVNSAVRGGAFKPLIKMTESDFDRQFSVNTRGTFFVLREAASIMKDGGRIVNISSAITVNNAPIGASIYAGTKAAVEQFTVSLAKELGSRDITVNAVLPGTTDTEGFRKTAPSEVQTQAAKQSPFERIGQPQDIADVVSFLVSDRAGWLTGQKIMATGGSYL